MTVTFPAWLVYPAIIALVLAAGYFFARMALRRPRSLWVVGEFKGVTKRGLVIWEMKGAYTDRARALAGCTDKHHFMVPVTTDQPIPEKGAGAARCEYPCAEAIHGA